MYRYMWSYQKSISSIIKLKQTEFQFIKCQKWNKIPNTYNIRLKIPKFKIVLTPNFKKNIQNVNKISSYGLKQLPQQTKKRRFWLHNLLWRGLLLQLTRTVAPVNLLFSGKEALLCLSVSLCHKVWLRLDAWALLSTLGWAISI